VQPSQAGLRFSKRSRLHKRQKGKSLFWRDHNTNPSSEVNALGRFRGLGSGEAGPLTVRRCVNQIRSTIQRGWVQLGKAATREGGGPGLVWASGLL